ncbi:MAG: hypothetical protein ACRDJC_24705, partial [Thermomicrobiales bacterium]
MAPLSESQGAPAPGTKRTRRRERSALKQKRLTAAAAQQRRDQLVRWGAIAVVALLIAVGVVAWLGVGRLIGDAGTPVALPGPEGGPRIAQDVGTLVGQPAPAFTLPDSEGQS